MTIQEVWIQAYCAAVSNPPSRLTNSAPDRLEAAYAVSTYGSIIADRAVRDFQRQFTEASHD